MALQRVIVITCDSCHKEAPVRTYTIRESGRAKQVDLCAKHDLLLESLMKKGSPVARKPRKSVR